MKRLSHYNRSKMSQLDDSCNKEFRRAIAAKKAALRSDLEYEFKSNKR